MIVQGYQRLLTAQVLLKCKLLQISRVHFNNLQISWQLHRTLACDWILNSKYQQLHRAAWIQQLTSSIRRLKNLFQHEWETIRSPRIRAFSSIKMTSTKVLFYTLLMTVLQSADKLDALHLGKGPDMQLPLYIKWLIIWVQQSHHQKGNAKWGALAILT